MDFCRVFDTPLIRLLFGACRNLRRLVVLDGREENARAIPVARSDQASNARRWLRE